MELTRLGDIEAERITGPIFETQAHRKSGASAEFDEYGLSVNAISFAPGERTTMHEHTVRQVLYVTAGEGIVAGPEDRFEVSPGDLISIPAGEPHWHGAAPTTTFEHISIVILDEEGTGTYAVEEPAGRRSE